MHFSHPRVQLTRRVRLSAWACVLAAVGMGVAPEPAGTAKASAALPGVAVVELFTSEGCSSCPPADKVLAGLSGERVYPLAFHVDYWDSLGWKDRWSSKSASDRQREYARVLKTDSVYTPQMIVNGRTQFVGSRGSTATDAVRTALATPAKVALTISASWVAKAPAAAGSATPASDSLRTLRASVTSTAPSDTALAAGDTILVALVENGLSSRVTAGENSGSSLKHEHVVRVWTTASPKAGSPTAIELAVPADVHLDRARIVAFAQRAGTLEVLGAVDASVPAP